MGTTGCPAPVDSGGVVGMADRDAAIARELDQLVERTGCFRD